MEEAKKILKDQLRSRRMQNLPGVAAAREERRKQRNAAQPSTAKTAHNAENNNNATRKVSGRSRATLKGSAEKIDQKTYKGSQDVCSTTIEGPVPEEEIPKFISNGRAVTARTNDGRWLAPRIQCTVQNDLCRSRRSNATNGMVGSGRYECISSRETHSKRGDSETGMRTSKHVDVRTRIDEIRANRSLLNRGCVIRGSKRSEESRSPSYRGCEKRGTRSSEKKAATFKRLFGSETEED